MDEIHLGIDYYYIYLILPRSGIAGRLFFFTSNAIFPPFQRKVESRKHRPLISGNKTVRINPTKLGCDRDPTSDETCFELESCFQIRNFPVNIETTIVKYKIMAEIYEGGKKISRVRFATNNGDLAHSNEKIIQVRRTNLDGCFKELVYLKQGTIDIRSPIKFLVEYSLGLDQPSVHGELSL